MFGVCFVVQVRMTADGMSVSARSYTPRYQPPDAVGVVSHASDYYALAQTLEEVLQVRHGRISDR